MPIPNPNKGEREDEFISRCMSEIGGEYDDATQAVAVCYSALRDTRGQRMSAQDLYISQMNEYRTKMTYRLQEECPPATQDIPLNLSNRQRCIDEANYGPLNPNEPNEEYWIAKAKVFGGEDIESAKKALCGNCAFFLQTTKILECIASGIGGEVKDEWDTIDAGDLGYCEAYDFKCAADRTCDAWVIGGPITD